MNMKNINHLSRVPKNEVLNTKSLQIITRKVTKTREDKGKTISTISQKHDYPNPVMQREIFKDTSQFFKYLSTKEDNLYHQRTKVNELLQFLSREDVFHRLIDIQNIPKEQPKVDRRVKYVYKINQVDRLDLDLQVNLDIEWVLIPQVFIDFRSQVNILPKRTSLKFG